MKVAIMQPYLFPYIGYFQLLAAVDYFVILDDVNFIKRGWINRNRILISNKEHTFTLPLEKASQNKRIKEHYIFDPNASKEKLVTTIRHAYGKAPCFEGVFPLIEEIILDQENNLSLYIANSIRKIANLLDIKTKIIFSDEINHDKELKAQDRIIDICLALNASEYINPYGGRTLYDKATFMENKINLNLLKARGIEYKQFNSEFVPWLSIIDLLMFNPIDQIKRLLEEYDLL